jgi:crotonobetainyl-CoA:carnitine CoA-transferase CaiB-like acyl-CoA transferase
MGSGHTPAPIAGRKASCQTFLMALPLDGIRVVSVEQFGAGPWATLQLADLGAEVIKIEDPLTRGDVGRYVPPYQEGEDSLFFETFNRGKQSISLDLRSPEGRSVFQDLVRECQVVFSNLRGDGPSRLKLLYEDLRDVNPRIVCCSLSGFGMTGPRVGEGGYDYVMQGLAGWMSLTGEPDGPPVKSGLSLVDIMAGYVAALAVVAAVRAAERDGTGCDCDISLFETALAGLNYVGTWAATRDYQPPRRPNSAHPSIAPFQNFATADGWVVVACPKDHFWRELCDAIERPDLADDARYESFAGRDGNRDQLLEELDAAFAQRTTTDWLQRLAPHGIPCAPVNDVRQALRDPQAQARGAVLEAPHERFGTVRTIASAVRVGKEHKPPQRAPYRGEHTHETLQRVCRYSDQRLAELSAAGVFGAQAQTGPPAEGDEVVVAP